MIFTYFYLILTKIFNYINQLKRSLLGTKEKQICYETQAWQIHSYGGINELVLSDTKITHALQPTDLLIKVSAASVNPIDLSVMHGYSRAILSILRGFESEFPLTLGRDFAGTIIDKGYGVSEKFKIGDKVYGFVPINKQGSHAQLVVANESHIVPQPLHLSNVEAASLLYAVITAWSALFRTGKLPSKDLSHSKILILGASGGVGTVAIQLLKSQNATVIGTCSTDAIPLVRSLGVDKVFDYKDENYIQNVAAEGKFDIILDCAKYDYQNIPKAWEYSKFITLNSTLLANTDKYGLFKGLLVSVSDLLRANFPKFLEGKSVKWAFFSPSNDGLKFIDSLIRKKQITPSIDKVFKFSELPKAYKALSEGHLRGKIVIDMEL